MRSILRSAYTAAEKVVELIDFHVADKWYEDFRTCLLDAAEYCKVKNSTTYCYKSSLVSWRAFKELAIKPILRKQKIVPCDAYFDPSSQIRRTLIVASGSVKVCRAYWVSENLGLFQKNDKVPSRKLYEGRYASNGGESPE
ncbi:hypothetical protein NM688_g5230 [Phlebia brevispora]|uniref:Uncharacterized protein n=1 Tax=Phlebia brevispora TaxID=194682 RepID=A0ACC1SYL0_9APHY|nr:hypothetical protein NM688_g5230 [Phlebia brevispora]